MISSIAPANEQTAQTTPQPTMKRQRQIVFDADNRFAERFQRTIAIHLGEIVKAMYLIANVRLISDDKAGLVDDLAYGLGIKIHCNKNIYI